MKFEDNNYGMHILFEWNEEENDIYEILQRFKYFLMAKSYSPDMVAKIQYLSDDQYARLNLTGEI